MYSELGDFIAWLISQGYMVESWLDKLERQKEQVADLQSKHADYYIGSLDRLIEEVSLAAQGYEIDLSGNRTQLSKRQQKQAQKELVRLQDMKSYLENYL